MKHQMENTQYFTVEIVMNIMPITKAEFEITHICDKMCEMCSHRIDTSSFTYIDPMEMYDLLECFKPKQIKSILIIGGEPLCHPQLEEILDMIKLKFPRVPRGRRVVSTNGRLLDTVPREIFNDWKWAISEYPRWNDEIIKKYKGKKNVRISGFGGWWDMKINPNISEKLAKQVEKNCFHQVRIIGTKLYRCCLSEGVEREFLKETVHVEMSPNWQNDWKKLPVWKACQHCFKANVILGRWNKPRNKNVKHN